jgi:Protein of unknown function (DUF2950)
MKIALFCTLGLCASTALAAPQSFADPEAAAAAVVKALEARDREALMRVFGPESEDVIISGDAERDRADRDAFLAAYRQMNRVAVEDDRVGTLYIGPSSGRSRSRW